MNIQSFGNILLRKTQNNFSINKYSQNPISFKGELKTDTLELHTTAQSSTAEVDAKYQQHKTDTLEKFKQAIAENMSKIAEVAAKKAEVEVKKNTAFQMVEDEDFLSQIEDCLITYQEEVSQQSAFYELDTLIRKQKITPERKEKLLTSLISRNFPDYLAEVQKDKENPISILELAKKIRKEQRQNIEDGNPKGTFDMGINKAMSAYEEKNAIKIDDVVKENISRALLESAGKNSEEFKKCLAERFDKEIRSFDSEIFSLQRKNESLEKSKENYLAHFKEDPLTACYYSPFLSSSEKKQELLATGVFTEIRAYDFPDSLIWNLQRAGVINPFDCKPEKYSYPKFSIYDLRDEQNKKIFDLFAGKENKLEYQSDIIKKFHVPRYIVEKMPLKKISIDYTHEYKGPQTAVLIDTTDEESMRLLEAESEKWARTKTKRSKYAFEAEHPCAEKEIPAGYLASLGFGNVSTLRKLVETGGLQGRIEEVQTEQGVKLKTSIDSSDPRLKGVLTSLREKNRNVASYKDLAKELGISQRRLLEDIADGKIDIIPEHMFVFDNEYRYIDKRTEKNKAYIETTLFEQEVIRRIEQEQAQQQREAVKQRRIQNKDALSRFQSLRMSLVWHFCPNTRSIGSDLARKDGYLCSLLAKDASEEESLTRKEQIKVDSYRKEMWLRSGTEELKEGFKQANEVLKQVKEGGLASVEDAEIRKIFENYGFVA